MDDTGIQAENQNPVANFKTNAMNKRRSPRVKPSDIMKPERLAYIRKQIAKKLGDTKVKDVGKDSRERTDRQTDTDSIGQDENQSTIKGNIEVIQLDYRGSKIKTRDENEDMKLVKGTGMTYNIITGEPMWPIVTEKIGQKSKSADINLIMNEEYEENQIYIDSEASQHIQAEEQWRIECNYLTVTEPVYNGQTDMERDLGTIDCSDRLSNMEVENFTTITDNKREPEEAEELHIKNKTTRIVKNLKKCTR